MDHTKSGAARIIRAREADLPALSTLAATIWRACYPGIITNEQIEYMLPRMYALERLRDEIRFEAIRYDRLLSGEEFVGFCSYGPTEQAGVFKLHKLYLLPDWQGRGYGRLLLSHSERETRKLGGHCLILNVNKNNVKAIKTYQRNGFEIAESVVSDIGGGFVMDDFVMAKKLEA